MRVWMIAGTLIAGGAVLALVGAGLSAATTRKTVKDGGPTVRGDAAMVVIVIGIVAAIFGAGLLVFRSTYPS